MDTPLKVLIVEDSQNDAELLVRELRRGGYDPRCKRVETAEAMKAALDEKGWDIVISDYKMPHFSAFSALELLKKNGLDLPFLIVSGSIGEDLAVEAMKAGAHDYIMKDNMTRLIPAVKRELQEAESRRERRRAKEELERALSLLRATLDSTADGILVVDQEGKIVTFNRKFVEMWRIHEPIIATKDDSQALTLVLDQLKNPDEFLKKVRELYSQPDAHSYDVLEFNDGRVFERYSRPSRIGGKSIGRVWSFRDVTERRQAEETIQRLAYYDLLTGLPNRNLLHDRLQQAVVTGQRENKLVAFLLLDLDRFKEINDTIGHQNGDLLLQQVGMRLRNAVWEPDVVARLGGDEFAVLLPKIAAAEHVSIVANKILKALEAPFALEGLSVDVGASIGIALFPEHGEDADLLIQRADVAMYAAKAAGSNYAVYAAKQDRYSPRSLTLIGELRHAIEYEELVLHYQPKVDLKTGRVIGVEALVRWQHPKHGPVPPDQFIPLAERTGLIKPLTQWVLKEVHRQWSEWHRTGLNLPIAVNLSMRNLQDPQLPDQIAEMLRISIGAPDWLELEITESVIMADPTHTMETFMRLDKIGVRLSIDDFGTGYSSLSYLKKLPVDEIKIDKSFVMDMGSNEDDAVIVLSIINLAHNLSLKVVAEGVESQEISEQLAAFGCDAAQGYHMARPMPVTELVGWLKESPWGLKGALR